MLKQLIRDIYFLIYNLFEGLTTDTKLAKGALLNLTITLFCILILLLTQWLLVMVVLANWLITVGFSALLASAIVLAINSLLIVLAIALVAYHKRNMSFVNSRYMLNRMVGTFKNIKV